MPAVAPNLATYATHTPYLTLAEWLAAPTAIDTSDLIRNGTLEQQHQVVQDKIERASSWVDAICRQPLAATVAVHSGRFLVNRWGTVRVLIPQRPVLEVSQVWVGMSPSSMTLLGSLADVDIGAHGVVEIPVFGAGTSGSERVTTGSRPIVRVQYVAGFPNTTLGQAVALGTSSISVVSPLGLYPGSALTVYDTAPLTRTEQVSVASTYTLGSTTVPLVGPLVASHLAGVSVSAVPPRVKEACVLLTSALIQTRGDDAIVLDSVDAPARTSGAYGANADAERLAGVLLGTLRRGV